MVTHFHRYQFDGFVIKCKSAKIKEILKDETTELMKRSKRFVFRFDLIAGPPLSSQSRVGSFEICNGDLRRDRFVTAI